MCTRSFQRQSRRSPLTEGKDLALNFMKHRLTRPARRLVTALSWAFAVTQSLAANAAVFPLPDGCSLVPPSAASAPARPLPSRPFPGVALQVRTMLEPTMFASAGRYYLIYELDLQNYSDSMMTLLSLEVMDVSRSPIRTIATLDAAQLNALLRPTGVNYLQYPSQPHVDANRALDAGRSALAFLCLAFDDTASVPRQLRHRVHLENTSTDGPAVTVHRAPLPVFAPLLEGSNWHPRNGPNLDTHHHMGYMVEGGMAQNGRRFAIDWRKSKDGKLLVEGDPRDVHAYPAYGERLFAVADGIVVAATDGYPDNVPKTAAGFEPAVPLNTYESILGNKLVLQLANGQFAQYAHMQAGSVRVKAGDRVRRGQWLGRVGNSGDSRSPHVHFQLASAPDFLASEGLPFVFDRFRMTVPGQDWSERTQEFPWGEDTVVDFGANRAQRNARSQ